MARGFSGNAQAAIRRAASDDHPVVVRNFCDVEGALLYSFLGF
jgi:hypothetical protein